MSRHFALVFVFLVSALAAPAAPPAPPPEWPEDAARQRLHMIGNGHIDPVWLWPWQEGVSLVHGTFRSALDRMNETPGFCFTASSALFYEWVEQNDPAMLDEIRRRVAEGRWGLAGGWWVEPDLNIPNGESLVRQGLYGQRSYRRLFGRHATTGFNPDGFGHPGSLPQILKLQRLENYVFMRPNPAEKTLPAGAFWWVSPDGSRVLAHRIPISYGDKGLELRERLQQILALPPGPFPVRMAFYGVGDHGGGGTRLNIRSLQTMQSEDGAPEILFSTPDRYFDAIRKLDAASSLPEVNDELQHHAVGCYTAHSEIKKQNRSTELALMTAEKITAIGSAAWGNIYPRDEFTAAWKRILFQQFHDSLAGTSLPEHYEFSRAAYGGAQAAAIDATGLAVQKLAWQVPATDPESDYYLVFNPHAWPATLPVEQEFKFKQFPDRLEDAEGHPIPFQTIIPTTQSDRRRHRFAARVRVPAFGYQQIRFSAEPGAKNKPAPFDPADTSLENECLRVTFDGDGRMTLFDKTNHTVVVRSAKAIVIDDQTDTWGHRTGAYDRVIGEFAGAEIKTVEQGAVHKTVRVRTHYGASTLTVDWMLCAGSRRVEARAILDWHEQLKLLKFSFPTGLENPVAAYETAYGSITRPANGDEEPGHRWVSLDGVREGRAAGLAIINDAKYGYSTPGPEIRVSVARGAPYALHRKPEPGVDYLWMDQGVQTLRMLLIPHDGAWGDARLTRAAEEFTAPVPVIFQGIHPGVRAQSDSFLSIDADNITIAAIKLAEDNDDLVLRCHETEGRPADAAVRLHFAGKTWNGHFRPHELKTLRFNRSTGTFREASLLEE